MYQANNLQRDGITVSPEVKDSFFEQVLSSGPGMVVIVDGRTLKIVYHNLQLKNKLGYTTEDITTENFSLLDIIEPSQHTLLALQLQHVSMSEGARNKYVIYKVKNKEGKYANYFLYASPISDYQSVTYHVLLLPAFSNWQQPYLSFDSKELFLEQFSGLGFGTFEWMIESDKIFWSDGVYEIFELEKSTRDLSLDFVLGFTHPDDQEKANAALFSTLEKRDSLNVELRIVTNAQKTKIINTLGRLVLDESGKPVKLVGSIMDVTNQRQMAQTLETHVNELNRSNQELEEFAYVASHDLQEPLRKITTFCDRLSEKYGEKLPEDGTMYMQRIVASAENMRTLIYNLLEFSRVTRTSESFHGIDLNAVLQQVKMDLELLIEETGTSVNIGELPFINCSVSQMKQLFTNLVNNAIKFRRPGISAVIDISAKVLSDYDKHLLNIRSDGNYYEIIVSDNGIGFDNEYATKIFQIFQRLHGKTEYPGSGIGLAICKKIVDHHNGKIFASGQQQNGAMFSIILPEQ